MERKLFYKINKHTNVIAVLGESAPHQVGTGLCMFDSLSTSANCYNTASKGGDTIHSNKEQNTANVDNFTPPALQIK